MCAHEHPLAKVVFLACAIPGVIREEAEMRVGSSAKLEAAVLRGAIMEVEEDGEMMYYFKENSVGVREELSEQHKMARSKKTTDEAFSMVADMVKNLGWSIKAQQKDLEAGIHAYIQMYSYIHPDPLVHLCSCSYDCCNATTSATLLPPPPLHLLMLTTWND